MAAAVPVCVRRGPSPFPRAPAPLLHTQSHGTKYSKTCCSAAGAIVRFCRFWSVNLAVTTPFGSEPPERLAMCSWRIPSLLRCFFGLPVLFALTMGTILTASTSSRADVEPKRVLMLHSFGLRFKPWTDHAQFIREEISSRISAQFHDHSLVSARLAGDKSEGPFVDYLQALYADKPPDLIVAIGAPAAVIATNSPDQSRPFLDHRRTRSPSL